jgi:N,N'-diacetyllegionaminate synthase
MKFKIGSSLIGENNKAFIIAEIGVNHNGEYSLAKKLIDQAILCGADCVKFQTFTAGNVVTKNTELAKYQIKNKVKEKNQFDMLKNLELSKNDFKKLFLYCKKRKIEFLSTPVSFQDVNFLDKLGVNSFKLASMHASEPEFIRYVASKNKPLIASTGMCTSSEVKEMAKIIKKTKNKKVCIMQCTSNYPSIIEDSNINVLKEYKKFGFVLGYSDHTTSDISAITALALGAKVFEKTLYFK